MLIYEKDNKLNINFENSMQETPDLQIGKDGDKTEVLIDGSSNPTIPTPAIEDNGKFLGVSNGEYALASAGGSNAPIYIEFSNNATTWTSAKSFQEIVTAYMAGTIIFCGVANREYGQVTSFAFDRTGTTVTALFASIANQFYDIESDGTVILVT